MSQFCEASPRRDMGQGKKLTYCTTLKITIVVFKQTQRHVDVEPGLHIQHIIISDHKQRISAKVGKHLIIYNKLFVMLHLLRCLSGKESKNLIYTGHIHLYRFN